MFICGHSHILLVKRVASWGGLHLNPGAAGRSGFHKVCTMLKFDVLDGSIDNMKVVEWRDEVQSPHGVDIFGATTLRRRRIAYLYTISSIGVMPLGPQGPPTPNVTGCLTSSN